MQRRASIPALAGSVADHGLSCRNPFPTVLYNKGGVSSVPFPWQGQNERMILIMTPSDRRAHLVMHHPTKIVQLGLLFVRQVSPAPGLLRLCQMKQLVRLLLEGFIQHLGSYPDYAFLNQRTLQRI